MQTALKMTAIRVSTPKIPFSFGAAPFLCELLPEDWPMIPEIKSPTEVPVEEGAALSFFAFFALSALETTEVDSASSFSSGTSGSVGSMYVSRSDENATAAATQTIGVRVSINRTMTPAK